MDKMVQCKFVSALETLPLLTRVVFLLNCSDDLSYAEIGWRCGISIDEVAIRIGDALAATDRTMRSGPSFAGRIRRAMLPCRKAWAAARMREGDRRLAPWMPSARRPGRRGSLDWLARAYELILR